MNEIERTLRRTTSTPHAKLNREQIEGLKLEIQQILGALNAAATFPDDNTVVEGASKVVEDGLCCATPAARNGASS